MTLYPIAFPRLQREQSSEGAELRVRVYGFSSNCLILDLSPLLAKLILALSYIPSIALWPIWRLLQTLAVNSAIKPHPAMMG